MVRFNEIVPKRNSGNNGVMFFWTLIIEATSIQLRYSNHFAVNTVDHNQRGSKTVLSLNQFSSSVLIAIDCYSTRIQPQQILYGAFRQ